LHYAFDILALCLATFVFLAVVVDLVLLSHVAVVEAAKDVFAWSVDGPAKEEVGKEKLVAAPVQLVVSVRTHRSESLSGNFLKGVSRQSGEVFVEVPERRPTDDQSTLFAADHVEDHPWHRGQQVIILLRIMRMDVMIKTHATENQV